MVYSNRSNQRAIKLGNLNEILDHESQLPIKYLDEDTIKNLDKINILKILLVCNNHEQVELFQNELSKCEALTVVSSANAFLHIMASDTNKGNSLKILADKLSVKLDNVIDF